MKGRLCIDNTGHHRWWQRWAPQLRCYRGAGRLLSLAPLPSSLPEPAISGDANALTPRVCQLDPTQAQAGLCQQMV